MIFEIIVDFLQTFIASSNMRRIILYVFLMFYAESVIKWSNLHFKAGLRVIPWILILREIITAFSFDVIFTFEISSYLFSSAIVLSLLAWWYGFYIRQKNRIILYIIFTLLGSFIPLLINALLLSPPSLLSPLTIAHVHLIVAIILLRFIIFSFTLHNSLNAGFILSKRANAPFLFAGLAHGLLFLTGIREGILFSTLVSAIPFTLYALLLYSFSNYAQEQTKLRDEITANFDKSVFEFLQTIAAAITSRVDSRTVLKYALQTTVKLAEAEAGVVLLKDKENLRVIFREGYFPPLVEIPASAKARQATIVAYFENTPFNPEGTVLEDVFTKNAPCYVYLTTENEQMKINTLNDVQFINSFIAVPVIVDGELFCIIALAHRSNSKFFSSEIFEYIKILANYTSITLNSLYDYSQILEKREIEKDIDIASEIQRNLLPSRLPEKIRDQVGIWSKPLKGISGDYFDIISFGDTGKIAVIICDVAGKGVPASLVMVMIRTITHLVSVNMRNPAEIIEAVNFGVSEKVDVERFATMSYLIYDLNTRSIEYSNAAHHPLVILKHATKTIEKLDAEGLPIGIEASSKYSSEVKTLDPGDIIMLYTDGIIEALNPDNVQYEEERLEKALVSNADLSSEQIVEAIKQDLAGFVGTASQHDDQTLIVMKIT